MVTLFNLVLYIIPLLLFWRKYKEVNIYILLLSAYTVIAFLCFLNYQGNPDYHRCTVIPFVFLWLMVLIELSAYKNVNITTDNILIKENWALNTLTAIYIVSGFVSMYYNYPRVVTMFEMDDWANARQDFYESLDTSMLYSSQFERLMKNIHSYLGPYGVVMAFYKLCNIDKGRLNIIVTILLFVTWIGSTFFGATLTASRGIVVQTFLVILIGYVLFRKLIKVNVKKYLYAGWGIIAAIFAVYFSVVTTSRFGEGNEQDASFAYLGHSMLAFNEGIMGTMTSYADGKYFFGWIYQLLGMSTVVNENALGVTHQHAFFTSVGMLYYDFGPIGTVIFVLFFTVFLRRITRKKKYSLTDVMIIYFFADYLIKGVFVNGMNLSLTWMMLFVVVKLVQTAEKIR